MFGKIRSPRNIFLMRGNKKKSLGAKSGLLVDPSIRRFGRSKGRWFELMCTSLHCHCEQWFVFSSSFFKFLQRNCGVQLRIDRVTLLKWNSRYLTSLVEETGDHLFRSVFSTNNSRWIWLVFEGPHGGLLFCFELIRIDPWFVTCDDLINVFWSTAIVFFQQFYASIDKSLFWAIARFSENKSFFTARPFMLYLKVCHMTILHYQFTHGINVLWHNGRFRWTFTDFVF